MMNPAQIKAIRFGPVFGLGFKTSVEKKMVVRGEVVNEARSDGENLFFAVGKAVAVDFAFSLSCFRK
jgi:hypothetical protein